MEDMFELRCVFPNAFFIGYEELPTLPLYEYAEINNKENNIDKICNDFIFLQLDVMTELISNNEFLKYKTDQEQRIRNRTVSSQHKIFSPYGLFSYVFHLHFKHSCEYHPLYHGKRLCFAFKFLYLKELHLQFQSDQFQESLPQMCEFDQRSIDALLISCPNIEILKLYRFFMNPSNDSYTSTTITPCMSLKTLILEDCMVMEPEIFSFFSTKFPQLATLNIYLRFDIEFNNDRNIFNQAIQTMIASFSHLLHLKYVSDSEDYWMGRDLVRWLILNPNALYTFNLEGTSINPSLIFNDDDGFIINHSNKKSISNYNSSIERSFTTTNTNELYDYIVNNQHNKVIPLATTTLTLYGNPAGYMDVTFHFDKWLSILLNLKTLFLNSLSMIISLNNNSFYFSSLQHLLLYDCRFSSPDDLFTMCLACPSLKSLELHSISIKTEPLPLIQPLITIDLPQMAFEKIVLNDIRFTDSDNTFETFEPKNYKARKLIVNELGLKNTFTIKVKQDGNDDHNIHIVINCQSADVVLFSDIPWFYAKYFLQ
ncbi:hypothetical protein BJ944DRAFT_266835 [Cunninghamella echinulata]|nr:hypothetical protein BJ944DRAFT_266835 [Cunninghamella echinulata]